MKTAGSTLEGRGVSRDPDEAARWCLKAAEAGYANAQFNMGSHYLEGLGVTRNHAEALKWYHLAAAQGHQDARKVLEIESDTPNALQSTNNEETDPTSRALLTQGLVSQRRGDSMQAIRSFRQAADRGSAWGQNNLGVIYINGDGVQKDASIAATWFRKAANQGLREAQAALGTCYIMGDGVQKNVAEGARWYWLAAEQGDAVAQRQLSLMYAVGMGVPKSNEQAVRWAREAALRGDAQAKEWITKWDARQDTHAPPGATPSMGHRNPWGKAGERVVGTYSTFNAAYTAKQGMRGLVNANIEALEEQVSNAGDASMTVQRPPEYRIEPEYERGVWLLIEQKY
jgi:TPR repeat protein